jgi:hypothetical protein
VRHHLGAGGHRFATAVSLSAQNFIQAAVLKRLTGLTSIADLRIALSEGTGTLRKLAARKPLTP